MSIRITSLVEVLATYLFASTRIDWPGADGLTLETVVEEFYPPAMIAGHVPSLAELRRRHADLAGEFSEFFRRAVMKE